MPGGMLGYIGGGVAGAILMIIIGLIKSKMGKSTT